MSCPFATPIQGSKIFLDEGSTSQAPQIGLSSPATSCSLISPSTRGKWYLLQGDDHCYRASTQGSAFGSVLAVYNTITGCGALSCWAESGSNVFLSWATTSGVAYYILLAGTGEETGDYSLVVLVRGDNAFVLFDLCYHLSRSHVCATFLSCVVQ